MCGAKPAGFRAWARFLDLMAAGDGGHRIRRGSTDVWRYFFAQRRTEDGRIVTAPIVAMMVDRLNEPKGE